ncbi:MBL fold metallo-hydrolase [Paenibacillus sp. 598K]|uniref:MBL fold metallo-hydrolase n=1 Tax=Paenibacillus sp. 598K TaxID=1117987 RepID=UPI000FFF2A2F|nr:MBL fold metallo-hydrolase [Paenibacillus sp. 598K]
MTTLTFLGTSDAMGVPRIYCDCSVCEEARESGHNARQRASVLLQDADLGDTVIDCGPDWSRQMRAAGLRGMDRLLLTHAHFDHYGGLPEWADVCRWTGVRGEAHAPAEVIEEVLQRFPWLDRQIDFQPIDGGRTIGDWRVATWRVNHGKNGYSYAYRFDHQATGYAWVYCSDAIALTEQELAPMQGLDLLVLGTSFFREPYPFHTRSVYDVTEGIALAAQLQPSLAVFTHLSHDIDLPLRAQELPEGCMFARTGLRLELVRALPSA